MRARTRTALLSSVVLWTLASCGESNSSTHIPTPDLTGVEDAVAKKIASCRKALERDTRSPRAWGKLALTLDAHEFRSEAGASYLEAGRLDPKDVRWPYLRAQSLPPEKTAARLEAFEAAQRLDPDHPYVNLRVGQELLASGKTQEAAASFQRVRARLPRHPEALLGLARTRWLSEDPIRARELLELARATTPNFRPIHALLSEVYTRLGDKPGAEAATRAAQECPPNASLQDPFRDEVLNEGVSGLHLAIQGTAHLRRGEIQDATRKLTQAVQLQPENLDARISLGQALVLAGQGEAGLREIRSVLERVPDHLPALRSLAAALTATGDLDGSAEACRRVLDRNPWDGEVRLSCARVLLQLKRNAEALQVVKEALDQPHPGPRDLAAGLLATLPDDALRDGALALRIAERLCTETGRQNHAFLGTLSLAQAELGRFDDARKTLDAAIALATSAKDDVFLAQARTWAQSFTKNSPVRSY